MNRKNHPEAVCAVDYAFQRIGGKHKGRILYHLQAEVLRYGQLRRVITGVTPKMLTQALRELEEDGLLTRTVYLEVPPRVEYQLTATGRELLPFINLLESWGARQLAQQGIPEMACPAPQGLAEAHAMELSATD